MENKDSKKKELEEAAELLKNINFSDNNSNQLQELIKQIHILSNQKEEIERVYRDYPELNDDAFIKENLADWKKAVEM